MAGGCSRRCARHECLVVMLVADVAGAVVGVGVGNPPCAPEGAGDVVTKVALFANERVSRLSRTRLLGARIVPLHLPSACSRACSGE